MKIHAPAILSAAILISSALHGSHDADALYRRTGGSIEVPAKGCIAVANCQTRIPSAVFSPAVEKYANFTRLNVKRLDLPSFSVSSTPAEAMKSAEAAAAVFIVDSPSLPLSLVSPEGNWGILNVSAVCAGSADPEKLHSRLCTGLARVLLLSTGAAVRDGNSILGRVSRPEDLDALSKSPMTLLELRDVMNHLLDCGVERATSVTYRQACREGWAPAPTNAVQRAIAEQVRAEKERGPSNPLTIPPPKK